MIIEESYFVEKGQPRNNTNIRDLLVDRITKSPFVKSGDEFVFTHHDLGIDPLPDVVKDIIIVLNDKGIITEHRFSEEYSGNRGVNESRKITVKIP
jgi:hypothetical protein